MAEQDAPMPHPLVETILVSFGTTLSAGLITLAPNAIPGLTSYVQVLIGVVFLGSAVILARRENIGMMRFGIDLAGLLEPAPSEDGKERSGPSSFVVDLIRSIRDALPHMAREGGIALLIAAIVFPPFVVGYWWWYQPTHAFVLSWPPGFGENALTQLLVVALPEEAFFRGYLQTRLTDRFPATTTIFGAKISIPAWLLQSVAFAIVHFVTIQSLDRLAVFFPGLLFGWLRARRGSIGAALLLHALSNLLADFLAHCWQIPVPQ